MTKDSIIKLRKGLGLSQEAFGEQLGVHKLTISRRERGNKKPSQLALRQLERIRG